MINARNPILYGNQLKQIPGNDMPTGNMAKTVSLQTATIVGKKQGVQKENKNFILVLAAVFFWAVLNKNFKF